MIINPIISSLNVWLFQFPFREEGSFFLIRNRSITDKYEFRNDKGTMTIIYIAAYNEPGLGFEKYESKFR